MGISDKWMAVIESLKDVVPNIDNERMAFQLISIVHDLFNRIGKDERLDQKRFNAMQRIMSDEERFLATNLRGEYWPPPAMISDQSGAMDDAKEDDSDI